jgi:hypothetical protein
LMPVIEDNWDVNGNKLTHENYTFQQYHDLLDTRYGYSAHGYKAFFPGSVGQSFHDDQGQDNWNPNQVDMTLIQISPTITSTECKQDLRPWVRQSGNT